MSNSIRGPLLSFFKKYKKEKYPQGYVFITADESLPQSFFLSKGLVRMYEVGPNGEEITLNLFRDPAVVSLLWSFADVPNKYYFEAFTSVTVWRAPAHEVKKFLEKKSSIVMSLTKNVFRGLPGLFSNLQQSVYGSSQKKVINMLLILAERFGKRKRNAIELDLPFSHARIAALIGISRETATRELGKLKKKEYIYYSPRSKVLQIWDKEGLEEILQE